MDLLKTNFWLLGLILLPGLLIGYEREKIRDSAIAKSNIAPLPISRQTDPIPTIEWEITKLTGEVITTNKGPGPPEGICEVGTETFNTIPQDSFIELILVDETQDENAADNQLNQIIADFQDLKKFHKPIVDVAHLFIFHFEFDNGHHSNEVLTTLNNVAWDPLTGASLDDGSILSALGKLQEAFGGDEDYFGSWVPESTVVGIEALKSGNGETGKSIFWVTGKFDSPQKISGEWGYIEKAQLFDCTTKSEGAGKWEAVARLD